MKRLNMHYENGDNKKFLMKNINRAVILLFIIASFEIASVSAVKAANRFDAFSDSTSGTVAPLAQFKKNADKMFKMMKTTKQQWISKLPSKADVGVPIYPGAKLVVYQQGFHDSKNTLLPEVIVVSPDPVKKIVSWYTAKLKGWKYIKDYNAFEPAGKNVDVMSNQFEATPHIQIEKAFSKNQFDGMFLKQPSDTKTGIVIRFQK